MFVQSCLKQKFCEHKLEQNRASRDFVLALGPLDDSNINIHKDRKIFYTTFWVLGTSKRLFPLKTQHRSFSDHNTFSKNHSVGKKVNGGRVLVNILIPNVNVLDVLDRVYRLRSR